MSGSNQFNLVLTIIGDDRPGLVERLADVISRHQGNWLESSMSHLAGQFAGILRVDVPAGSVDSLQQALAGIGELKIVVESSLALPAPGGRKLTLSLVGHDRVGIVREVSQVLVRHGVNVEALETRTASAPMSAATLFHADAELLAPAGLDARALKADLEQLSNDLMVDLSLGEIV